MARRRLLVVLLLPLLVWSSAGSAQAGTGDLGHDVSYPQCDGPLPLGGSFGIVGVNGGLPFSANPCLADQTQWAAATGEWALYINTANPGHHSPNWPETSAYGCTDRAVDTDAGCAYGYGRAAAANAVSTASSALSGTGLNPLSVPWWLDVEGSRTPGRPGNSWVGSGAVNAADLQGFVDGLRAAGVREVGVYSTSYQWGDITGGYTRSTSNAYRAGWPFRPESPIEDGPVWFAGVGTLDNAQRLCGTTGFTGGERLLAQYADGAYDGNYRCADPDLIAPLASQTAPTSRVTMTSTVRAAWTGSDVGSGLASYDLRTLAAPSNGGWQGWRLPAAWQRTSATSATMTRPYQGWTTCLSTRSRDAAGNVSAWSSARCTAVPLDDRSLSASTGWTRTQTSGWFGGTSTVTSRYGAYLTKAGLQTKRLHLIALRCATCGKVAVYVGGKRLTTVNLYAAKAIRATIALPTFAYTDGRVTIKVVTSGKKVRIDGLATSRI